MDFVVYDNWEGFWLPIILWLGGGFLVGGVCFVMSHRLQSLALLATAFLVAILGMAMAITSSDSIAKEHRTQVATQFNEFYGTDLDQVDVYRLNYPRYMPEGDRILSSVGDKTLKDGKITSDEISLVWEDGKMKLFQQTGTGVSEEMPRVK